MLERFLNPLGLCVVVVGAATLWAYVWFLRLLWKYFREGR